MTSKRCCKLLLFSKLPETGLVKTRLTTLKDGMLDPQTAKDLYEAMLLDVVAICLAALDELQARHPGYELELLVSTAPAANASAMEELLREGAPKDGRVRVIVDEGASFDEHYDDAFRQAWEAGADCILSMGADMPALTVGDVTRGFEALGELMDAGSPGIVLAPDQEMGVSIVGWTRETAFDHRGVFYNPSGLTVLPAYIQKARACGIEARYLPPVPDVDTMADLFHAITLVEALDYCASFDGNVPPRRTRQLLCELGLDEVRVMPNGLFDPRDAIDGA